MKHIIWSTISRALLIGAFACPIFCNAGTYFDDSNSYAPVLNSSAGGFMLLDNDSGVPFVALSQNVINNCCGVNNTITGTMRLGVEFAGGRYIANKENYGGITFFAVPNKSIKHVHPLFEAKAFKLEKKNWAGSIGLGFRAVDFCDGYIFGINTYYDSLRENSKTYNQWGVGLEVLSQNWELHINGYLPVGKTSHLTSRHVQEFLAGFRLISSLNQNALKGVEVSIGGRWNIANNLSIYIAPGGYFYDSKIGNIEGVEGTAEINWHDWITLRVNSSYDKTFKGRVQGVIAINFPLNFGCDSCNTCCNCCMSDLLGRPVRRNDLIFLNTCCDVERNWDDCGLRTDR